MDTLFDLYPLIQQFTGRNLSISKRWKESIDISDIEIISKAMAKYKYRSILGIQVPVKDIYDIIRVAIDTNDISTIYDIMFKYSKDPYIEWCKLVSKARSPEMLNLFLKKGCQYAKFYFDTYKNLIYNPDMYYHICHIIEAGFPIDNDQMKSAIEEHIHKNDLIYFSDNLDVILKRLDQYGYLDKYPIYKAIIQDNPVIFHSLVNRDNIDIYISIIFSLDAKNIYDTLSDEERYPGNFTKNMRGRILYQYLQDSEHRDSLLSNIFEYGSLYHIDLFDLLVHFDPKIVTYNRSSIIYAATVENWLHFLNRYIRPEDIYEMLFYAYDTGRDITHIPLHIYSYIQSKGIKVEWLAYYIERIQPIWNPDDKRSIRLKSWIDRNITSKPPSSVWKRILANIFGNPDIITGSKHIRNMKDTILSSSARIEILRSILSEHRDEITKENIEKLSSISGLSIGTVKSILGLK